MSDSNMTNKKLIDILRTGSRALVVSLRYTIADRLEYLDERVDIMSADADPDPREPQEISEQTKLL